MILSAAGCSEREKINSSNRITSRKITDLIPDLKPSGGILPAT